MNVSKFMKVVGVVTTVGVATTVGFSTTVILTAYITLKVKNNFDDGLEKFLYGDSPSRKPRSNRYNRAWSHPSKVSNRYSESEEKEESESKEKI